MWSEFTCLLPAVININKRNATGSSKKLCTVCLGQFHLFIRQVASKRATLIYFQFLQIGLLKLLSFFFFTDLKSLSKTLFTLGNLCF